MLAATVALVLACSAQTGGEWIYPLDDTYIHLELAWRLAQEGTWGVNPGEPASASSSPLWSLLLALGMALVGHEPRVALVLASLASVAAVGVADRLLGPDLRPLPRLTGLTLVAALTPLPAMAALGMEHSLQVALTLACGAAAVTDLREPCRGPGSLALMLLAALVATRFEGMFLAAAWAALALSGGRPWAALRVGLAAALPIAVFAAFSLALDLPPLPAGLLMKSKPLDGHALQNLWANVAQGGVLILPVALVWALDAARGGPLAGSARARLLALTTALHLGFGAIGWYYRYEAWLVAWAVLLAVRATADWRARPPGRRPWVEGLLLIALALAALQATGRRAYEAHAFMPGRALYIADAKVHLAQALAQTDPTAVVALHDIGAMAWETDLRVVDTAGLGTVQVLRLSRDRAFTGPTIGALTRSLGATVGLGTWSWMEHDRPEGWRPAARLIWGLDAQRSAEPIVAYAIAPGGEEVARAWLLHAATQMEGRGRVEVLDGEQWRPAQ